MNNYRILKRLAPDGKDGSVFEVKNGDTRDTFAMKKFTNKKGKSDICSEVVCQALASRSNITPKIHEVDQSCMVMDKLNGYTLPQYLYSTDGVIPDKHQKRLLHIFRELDKVGVFHQDPNPFNFMFHNDQMWIIDFGMAKRMFTGENENQKYMVPGLIVMIREKYPNINMDTLIQSMNKEDRQLYNM